MTFDLDFNLFKFLLNIVWLGCWHKGQLISKGLVGILNSSKKRTKKFDLQYYDTSGQLVFILFLEELKTPKSPFKINWPLIINRDNSSLSLRKICISDQSNKYLIFNYCYFKSAWPHCVILDEVATIEDYYNSSDFKGEFFFSGWWVG